MINNIMRKYINIIALSESSSKHVTLIENYDSYDNLPRWSPVPDNWTIDGLSISRGGKEWVRMMSGPCTWDESLGIVYDLQTNGSSRGFGTETTFSEVQQAYFTEVRRRGNLAVVIGPDVPTLEAKGQKLSTAQFKKEFSNHATWDFVYGENPPEKRYVGTVRSQDIVFYRSPDGAGRPVFLTIPKSNLIRKDGDSIIILRPENGEPFLTYTKA